METLTMLPEVCCPACPTVFHVPEGFVRHMAQEHWCDPATAGSFWQEAVQHCA